jgi:hypothetical protein
VPAELVEARQASGQGTEYRATDKAKLRKRNQQHQKKKAKQKKQQS